LVIETGQPVMLDTYEHNRATGSFILVDPVSNEVVAAGMVSRVTPSGDGSVRFGTGQVVWLTGLSGAGKSTVADAVAERLRLDGVSVSRLDGDDLRGGLNSDLGFSPEDRRENLRRAAHVARLMAHSGHVTLCSFITPMEADRTLVREIVGDAFLEVYVKASLETCEARDVKGHYKRARSGELANFTGVSAPFEDPANADVILDTSELSVDEAAQQLVDQIRSRR
jgi:bifunctional enzyme CysN/CysC